MADKKFESVGERVYFRRAEVGMSQEELGRRLGVSQQAIHKLESGITQKMRDMAKMAQILGVRVEWLLYGDEPMCDHPTPPTLDMDALAAAVRGVYIATRNLDPEIGESDFVNLVLTIYGRIQQEPQKNVDAESIIQGILEFRRLNKNNGADGEEGG